MHAVAQRIAAKAGCALAVADDPLCSTAAFERPVESCADLDHAFRGGWAGRLTCQRYMAAMKPTKPCPGVVDLDIRT